MMGGGVGKSESDSNQQSNFNTSSGSNLLSSATGTANAGNQSQFGQNVWGPQGAALTNLYQALGGIFDQSSGGMQGQIPGAVGQQQGIFNAANPAWQQQMAGGAYGGMPLQQNYQNALQGGGNEQFINESIMGGAGNNYADAMKGQLQQGL